MHQYYLLLQVLRLDWTGMYAGSREAVRVEKNSIITKEHLGRGVDICVEKLINLRRALKFYSTSLREGH